MILAPKLGANIALKNLQVKNTTLKLWYHYPLFFHMLKKEFITGYRFNGAFILNLFWSCYLILIEINNKDSIQKIQ